MNLAEKIKHVRERRLYAQRLLRACDWLEARYLQQAELAALTPTEAVARFGLTMFSARTLVSRVRRLAGYAVVVLVVAGCAGKGTVSSNQRSEVRPSLPPMPAARVVEGRGSKVQAAAIAPQPARTLKLSWTKGDPHPETVTQVWVALEVWTDPPEAMIAAGRGTMLGEFAEPHCELPATGIQNFFIIRNRLGNELSDWARK
jgi:hypothetical protein